MPPRHSRRSGLAALTAAWIALGGAVACSGDPGGGTPEGAEADAGGIGPAAPDAGPVPDLGDPIEVAPTEEWTWVPIESSACADGTEAGVGVNFTTRSRDLLVFFQGNGVCYDQATCTLFQGLLRGMGADPLDHMWWGDPNTGRLGIFDRTDPENPLRDSNFVVFPHCGVDGHTADKVSSYPPLAPVHQHGYRNVTVALRRIVPTFLDAGRIVVAGFSAGAIGAGANYHQIALAFEAVGQPPPDLLADAGPVLRSPYLGPVAQAKLRTGWGLDDTLGTFCPDCASEGYHMVHEVIARLHPGLRASVICSYGDAVATPLYVLLNNEPTFNGARLEEGLRDLSEWSAGFQSEVAPSAQREFLYPGARHGALVVDRLQATPGLSAFLRDQLEDSPAWETVHQ